MLSRRSKKWWKSLRSLIKNRTNFNAICACDRTFLLIIASISWRNGANISPISDMLLLSSIFLYLFENFLKFHLRNVLDEHVCVGEKDNLIKKRQSTDCLPWIDNHTEYLKNVRIFPFTVQLRQVGDTKKSSWNKNSWSSQKKLS